MIANDLMIGDYVIRKNVPKEILIVDAIDSIRDIVYLNLDGLGITEKLENIEPIPLTTKILEKNGFIIKEKWAQIGNFGNNPLIMWHFADDPILRNYNTELEIHQNDTGKVHVHIPCEYVHELQHALRLCGIDKEIKL